MSLVLSRKEQESIVIFTDSGEQIVLTVESMASGQAKISFDAPGSVGVWREELLQVADGVFIRPTNL